MFTKIFSHPLVITSILIGFCLYSVRLFISGDLTLYIHPRYAVFSLASSIVAALILLAGVGYYFGRAPSQPHHQHSGSGSGVIVNSIAVVVLGLALTLPPQTLSSQTIGERSIKSPSFTSQLSPASMSDCPTEAPTSIEGWVFELDYYALACNEGRSIELTGFVMTAADSRLPNGYFYLGRGVMSCCAVDVQPFALPVRSDESYPENQWLTVRGTFQAAQVDGAAQGLAIEIDRVELVDRPGNPYEYIDRS